MITDWFILIIGLIALFGMGVFRFGFDSPTVSWLVEKLGDTPVRGLYIMIGLALVVSALLRIF